MQADNTAALTTIKVKTLIHTLYNNEVNNGFPIILKSRSIINKMKRWEGELPVSGTVQRYFSCVSASYTTVEAQRKILW